ncbi:cyclin-dependent kinase 4 inhibitor B [Hoplias malabaricus]|uniref:cyclin-dependent kinase 4 inhibitor B n=1 Tax=Hoplias malabaricus TaxID=27720 RepID=UPI0034635533
MDSRARASTKHSARGRCDEHEARARMQEDLANAAATGNTECVEHLLQSGADVNGTNRFGRTPVQVMMMGSARVARLLLSHGADPNVQDASTHATPLHDAARGGFQDTVRVLLEFKADPELRDSRGHTAAERAREHGHEHTAEIIHNHKTTMKTTAKQQ